MRYALIRKMDISNGEGVGVSLFLQGCHFHCKGCFNPETWDPKGGKEWTPEVEKKFLKLIQRPYIKRVSFLGGEPLDQPDEVADLMKKIRDLRPEIKIWIYSGYKFEDIFLEDLEAIKYADVLVDGQFEYDKKDLSLAFRGSSNQRILELKNNEQLSI